MPIANFLNVSVRKLKFTSLSIVILYHNFGLISNVYCFPKGGAMFNYNSGKNY